MFSVETVMPAGPLCAGVVVVTPRHQDGNWVFGMDAARLIAKTRGAYALVVNLGGEMWGHARAPEEAQPQTATIMVNR
jgi:hypothetical protein